MFGSRWDRGSLSRLHLHQEFSSASGRNDPCWQLFVNRDSSIRLNLPSVWDALLLNVETTASLARSKIFEGKP